MQERIDTFEAPEQLQTSLLGRVVDRVIYQLSPQWGARRYAAREFSHTLARRVHQMNRSQWRSGSDDRMRGDRFIRGTLSPDSEADLDLETLQRDCLELYKSNPIGRSAVEARVNNVVGTGIRFQARLHAEPRYGITQETALEFNRRVEDVLRRWSENGADRKGTNSLTACQRIVDRTFANYGEAFVELVNDPASPGPIPLKWDIIDPFRVRTPARFDQDENVRLGIRYDSRGRVVGYYVFDELDGDLHVRGEVEKYRYVKRYDNRGFVRMCHVMEQLFPEQTRGFPWLSAARAPIRDLDDWREAEIINKQIQACFSVFIKSSSGESPYESARKQATSTVSNRRIEELEPGRVEYIGEDDDIKFANPTQGAAVLAPFVEYMLRTIAGAADMPYEMLAKDFSRVTFASGRLAALDGRVGFLARRQIISDTALTPTYKLAVYQALLMTDELDGVVDMNLYLSQRHVYERHACLGSGWQYINPKDEVRAHVDARDGHQETLSESLGERGVDFEEHMAQDTRERLAEVEQEITIRKRRWQLEEQNGLPHESASGSADAGTDGDDDSSDEPSGRQQRERQEAGAY